MTRTESFVPRETHFRSPFEASRPHLRAQSHSFIFYQARASASCPPLPPFSNPTRARASLFLRDGTSHHRRLLGQISISDSSFARKISRDNAFNVSRDVLSRDQTLSSRKQGRDPKGFLLLTDPPSRYTLEPPFPLPSPQMAPSSLHPFVLSRKPRFWDFTLSGALFDFFPPRVYVEKLNDRIS